MPTTWQRAWRWVASRKATYFWFWGMLCVRLNVEPSSRNFQSVVVGIDPGSKREAFTIKAKYKTLLNVLAYAVDWVVGGMEVRNYMRRGRRYRKTPYRQPRFNRSRGGLPPSTKARWQLKLRVVWLLVKIFPVSGFVVEDIKAETKGQRKWDVNFSPIEVGKNWFYEELGNVAPVKTKQGYETCELRSRLGLKKTGSKLEEKFSAHNVDSWVLAWDGVGGKEDPDDKSLLVLVPLRWHRRKLHMLQPSKGGKRRSDGGTRSLGFKRGSLIRHPKWGLCYIGGTSEGRITLKSIPGGEVMCRNAKPRDIEFRGFSSFRFYRKGTGN